MIALCHAITNVVMGLILMVAIVKVGNKFSSSSNRIPFFEGQAQPSDRLARIGLLRPNNNGGIYWCSHVRAQSLHIRIPGIDFYVVLLGVRSEFLSGATDL